MKRLFALLLVLALAGCGMPFTPETFNASAEARALRSILDRFALRDFATIQAQLDPGLIQPDIQAALERTADAIPSGSITKVEPVSWHVFNSTDQQRTTSVAAEYTFGERQWIVVSAQLTGEPSAFRILQFHVEPLSAPLSQINAFTFAGKNTAHYVFFLAAVAAMLVSIWALVSCARTKGLRRRWLWVIFIALGFVRFTINWSSGSWQVNPLAFNLLSAGFMRQGWLGPWLLTFCVPIGALVFLWRQRTTSHNASVAG